MAILRKVSLILLGILFITTGVYHFVNPGFYYGIMPPWLPAQEFFNVLAGIAEIGLAVMLWTRWKHIASMLIVLMLVIFLMVHIWHLTPQGMQQVGAPEAALWLRMCVQMLLIAWVWWSGKSVRVGSKSEQGVREGTAKGR